MPELIALHTEKFTFSVWTKDITSSQERLEKTLKARAKTTVPSCLLLSPPLLVKGHELPIRQHDLEETVFFENKQYDIEFVFHNSLKDTFTNNPPAIEHRLKAVEESFHYSVRSNSLRAAINTGNDIGWFRIELVYQLDQEQFRQSFSFEVLPTKIDMFSDLDVMNSAIDSVFPFWRFSLAEKTQQNMHAVRMPHPQFLLLWLAQFESLLGDLQTGLRHIVNSPHSRLISTSRVVTMDKLKGKLPPRLEKSVMLAKADADFKKRFHLSNKRLSVDTSENRFIKSVISTFISKLAKIADVAQKMESMPDRLRLSHSFFTTLGLWQKNMRFFQRQPLFREVGAFKALQRESLVLQQKPGYAKVYKAWQQLKWYLDFLDGDSSLSLRSVSELYEVWCFLEVRRILLELGFKEVRSSPIRIVNNVLDTSFKDGMKGSFKLRRDDGISLRLAHEPKFLPKGNPLKTWITIQKPDIFLEAKFPQGERVVWIFDAKYRIKKPSDFQESSDSMPDEVPDDAINQMHRYRDALIRQEIDNEGNVIKARPVFGAYALYPGFFDQQNEENPYQSAIDEIGIGAFSLLPATDSGGSIWLTKFLTDKLRRETTSDNHASPDRYFVEEAPRIPYQGTKTERYSDLVIAANQLGPSRDREYIHNFELGRANFYHTKQLAFERQRIEFHIVREARYIAVALDIGTGISREISFIYPILSVKRIQRKKITSEQSGTNKIADPDELYWLFSLGDSLKLNQRLRLDMDSHFELKLIGLKDFSHHKKWSEIENRYAALLSF